MARKSIKNLIPTAVRHVFTELGNLLTAARKERKLSQADLARKVGVGRMTIVRMEHGAPEIAIGYYLTAAWVLGLPILSWSDFAMTRIDTTIADILERYRSQLPARIRERKEDLDNDF